MFAGAFGPPVRGPATLRCGGLPAGAVGPAVLDVLAEGAGSPEATGTSAAEASGATGVATDADATGAAVSIPCDERDLQ